MDTLEDQMGDNPIDDALTRFDKIDVFRTDHHIHRPVLTKSRIHATELCTKDLHQFILQHDAVNDVAVSDEVCNEGVFRLIVDVYGCTDLLDVTLVHDNDGIRHGKGFFLIMCDINESDAKFVFQADQLILHVLTELEVQSTKRLVQKQKLRFVYNSAGNSDTLLLTAA